MTAAWTGQRSSVGASKCSTSPVYQDVELPETAKRSARKASGSTF